MKKMSGEESNHFGRGKGPDAPVSNLNIGTKFDIPVSHEHREQTPKEWHNFMLAACGCPERVCEVVIGR